MTERGNVVDLVAEIVYERIKAETGLDQILGYPNTAATEPDPAPAKPRAVDDARVRATRTLAQGAAATVVVAASTAVVQVVGAGGVDLFSGAGWKAIAVAAATASLTAIGSFVARMVRPPKGE